MPASSNSESEVAMIRAVLLMEVWTKQALEAFTVEMREDWLRGCAVPRLRGTKGVYGVARSHPP